MKFLFILKERTVKWSVDDGYGGYGSHSSGLHNSATFVVEMLNNNGVESKLVTVVDHNCIDREVFKHKPKIVVIEAFWVTPEKLIELVKLHPRVRWIVRNHSELPFLSHEGMAMDWAMRYLDIPNVMLSSNSERATKDFRALLSSRYPNFTIKQIVEKTLPLMNYYPTENHPIPDVFKKGDPYLNVGCFGAIRPLKNHLNQAIAAIRFSQSLGRQLRFHINGGRVEGNGEPILKNLKQLFSHLPAELVLHDWLDHSKFEELVRTMDIGMQVSFSETFNIVTADFVNNNVPVVASDEIAWVDPHYRADPTSVDDIVAKLEVAKAHATSFFHRKLNFNGLRKYDEVSKHQWLNYAKNIV